MENNTPLSFSKEGEFDAYAIKECYCFSFVVSITNINNKQNLSTYGSRIKIIPAANQIIKITQYLMKYFCYFYFGIMFELIAMEIRRIYRSKIGFDRICSRNIYFGKQMAINSYIFRIIGLNSSHIRFYDWYYWCKDKQHIGMKI